MSLPYQTINADVTLGGSIGTLLANRYRVIRQLGQGGMGSVWLAADTQLDNREVAIKMLPSILVSNRRACNQLKQEALVSLKLTHPNIAAVRAFEENGGNPFLVVDYIDGVTLDDYLADVSGRADLCVGRDGARPSQLGLPEAEVIRLLAPIAAALDYAHSRGVVHRDVKPGNVMIAKDGTPYILDFGIAREIQETMTRVTGKFSSGTLMYMSPEQLHGAAPKSSQDVYSFAAMAYECLMGTPPFSRGQIEYQIEHDSPAPLGPHFIKCGLGIMAGLAKRPEERPVNCAAVLGGNQSSGEAAHTMPTRTYQPDDVSGPPNLIRQKSDAIVAAEDIVVTAGKLAGVTEEPEMRSLLLSLKNAVEMMRMSSKSFRECAELKRQIDLWSGELQSRSADYVARGCFRVRVAKYISEKRSRKELANDPEIASGLRDVERLEADVAQAKFGELEKFQEGFELVRKGIDDRVDVIRKRLREEAQKREEESKRVAAIERERAETLRRQQESAEREPLLIKHEKIKKDIEAESHQIAAYATVVPDYEDCLQFLEKLVKFAREEVPKDLQGTRNRIQRMEDSLAQAREQIRRRDVEVFRARHKLKHSWIVLKVVFEYVMALMFAVGIWAWFMSSGKTSVQIGASLIFGFVFICWIYFFRDECSEQARGEEEKMVRLAREAYFKSVREISRDGDVNDMGDSDDRSCRW